MNIRKKLFTKNVVFCREIKNLWKTKRKMSVKIVDIFLYLIYYYFN